ncbi:MAG: hypothetical protein AW09_001034 [Candidatus Accumulibacter phosphatis]|uniref:Uncharacterized protein n=1 Tax=Candidatus Accumulibacter phosphatis TaxID=327160 RepID=A0A080LXS4_9PROT|nr:MAG: hypothetical protein AW09_001034 [Candidatus Accumulibacter phosphatis]
MRERLGSHRNLARGVREIIGRGANFTDDLAELADHGLHRRHQLADFVRALCFDRHRQVAFGQGVGDGDGCMERVSDRACDPECETDADHQRHQREDDNGVLSLVCGLVGSFTGLLHCICLEVNQRVDCCQIVGLDCRHRPHQLGKSCFAFAGLYELDESVEFNPVSLALFQYSGENLLAGLGHNRLFEPLVTLRRGFTCLGNVIEFLLDFVRLRK